MDENLVDLKVEEGIATLTINRPKSLNSLNQQVFEQMEQVLKKVAEDKSIKAMIVTGAGNKAFAAGADIAAFSVMTPIQAKEFSFSAHKVFGMLEQLPIPVIAAVNGYALGGGSELALACDMRVAATTARFGQPEVKLGIIPCFGGTQRLSRLVGKGKAAEMIFTGEMIDAETALSIGLVNAVVPPEQLIDKCKEILKKAVANGPLAVAYAKEAINSGLQMSLDKGCKYEVELVTDLFTTEDAKIGLSAFLNKQKPEFKGA